MVMNYIFIFCILFGTVSLDQQFEIDEYTVLASVAHFNMQYQQMYGARQRADWNYSTNETSDNLKRKELIEELYSSFMKKWKVWTTMIDRRGLSKFVIETLDDINAGIVMNTDDARMMVHLKSLMLKIYSSANISIPEQKIKAQGENQFSALMGKIRDPEVLFQLWESWRLQVGETNKPFFFKLINLSNKAAQENGYENLGSAWRKELGTENILTKSLSLWEEVKDLYAELHAYVRHKLIQVYGEEHFSTNGLIPAHLLGSLWGENWVALNDILTPYPDQPFLNLTEDFIAENYSVHDLIKKAEEFYVSIGLKPMVQSFWEKSMFVKPRDGRLVDCHAASYNFEPKTHDYRIRMCGEVKEQSFFEAVHEMGHIQYFMSYDKMPMLYRKGASSALHEAIGETMVYAIQSPQCLQLLNIKKSSEISERAKINNLMKQALTKIVLLPWALTVEIWRYGILEGVITEQEVNKNWWTLRKNFQGIAPPDEESATLFDAGSKYHVATNIPYLRYFLSRFIEHMFLDTMCGRGEDIHNCCFMNNKGVGDLLKNVLQRGAMIDAQTALRGITRKNEIVADSLLKYYEPLYFWLKDYNQLHNIKPVL